MGGRASEEPQIVQHEPGTFDLFIECRECKKVFPFGRAHNTTAAKLLNLLCHALNVSRPVGLRRKKQEGPSIPRC